MKLKTRYFGEIEFSEERIISLDKGLIGLENLKNFIIIDEEDEDCPFSYLQSIDDVDFCFHVINPYVFLKDYNPLINTYDLEKISQDLDIDSITYLLIISCDGSFENATVNLLAPLVINNDTLKGAQFIANNSLYTTKHKIKEFLEEVNV